MPAKKKKSNKMMKTKRSGTASGSKKPAPKSTGDSVREAGHAIGDAAKATATAIGDVAQAAMTAVGGAAKDSGHAIADASRATATAVSDAARATGKYLTRPVEIRVKPPGKHPTGSSKSRGATGRTRAH